MALAWPFWHGYLRNPCGSEMNTLHPKPLADAALEQRGGWSDAPIRTGHSSAAEALHQDPCLPRVCLSHSCAGEVGPVSAFLTERQSLDYPSKKDESSPL